MRKAIQTCLQVYCVNRFLTFIKMDHFPQIMKLAKRRGRKLEEDKNERNGQISIR